MSFESYYRKVTCSGKVSAKKETRNERSNANVFFTRVSFSDFIAYNCFRAHKIQFVGKSSLFASQGTSEQFNT